MATAGLRCLHLHCAERSVIVDVVSTIVADKLEHYLKQQGRKIDHICKNFPIEKQVWVTFSNQKDADNLTKVGKITQLGVTVSVPKPQNVDEDIYDDVIYEEVDTYDVPRNHQRSNTGIPTQARVMYDYTKRTNEELDIRVGDIITDVGRSQRYPEWWFGRLNGKEGLFPPTYVQFLTDADTIADSVYEDVNQLNIPTPESEYMTISSQPIKTEREDGYQALSLQQIRTKPEGERSGFPRRQQLSSNDNISPAKTRQKRPVLNILLLGETGAGKSTWINGLANYIKYQTLDEAVIGEELAPIRCKFEIRSQYDEYEVYTGYDENECYDKVGESCTQLPMTYVFTEDNFTIRLFDTPGIGDTRGIEQDNENMQHILDHISTFPVIHGICILLKSNVSRLTVQFKYCIKELLTQLHRDACQNVVFCFTNCRGSQYGPGGTFSALKELLKENKDVNIKPYFCFDNEAMQYLYATKHCKEFKPEQSYKTVCADSWNRAVAETEKLIMHIANLKPHEVQDTSSLNDARRNIFKLASPLEQLNKEMNDNIRATEKEQQKMDEIQDVTRILLKELITPIIRIDCTPLDVPKIVCMKCVQEIKTGNFTTPHYNCSINGQIGFWRKKLRKANNVCADCKCIWADHHKISYISRKVEELVVNQVVNDTINNKTASLTEINAHKIALQTKLKEYKHEQNEIQLAHKKFAYFLKLNSIAPYNENLLDYFEHFIKTELHNTSDLPQIEDKRERYKLMSTIIDKAISEDFADVTKPTAGDVKKLISDLGQLKHFGSQLRELQSAINAAEELYEVRFVDISSPGVTNNILTRVSRLFAH